MGHKCFISFKSEDLAYKQYMQAELKIGMVDKSLNQTIVSDDEDYVLRKIREEHLADSTVTIHLIGTRSAENLGYHEQRYIKRELQASLYDGKDNTRSGILGVVLPTMQAKVFLGAHTCLKCGQVHNRVAVDDSTVVREFSCNYYMLPHDKCAYTEDDRYCVLVSWADFCKNPEWYIEQAFAKRGAPVAARVKVYPK